VSKVGGLELGIEFAFKVTTMKSNVFQIHRHALGFSLTRSCFAGIVIILMMGLLFAESASAAPQQNGVQLNVSLGGGGNTNDVSVGLQLFLLFSVLSLAPSLIIMTTSFTRIVVVLSFLRTALGSQQPSSQVLVALALFMTSFIMYPVFSEINKDAIVPLREKKIELGEALDRASKPIKKFMLRHTREKDLELFISMAPDQPDFKVATAAELPMQVVIPAFMVSELRTAFQMGFTIFLPFLVIDMVVSSILMAMGMMMLPPTMVTLPTKILVFVLADGWGLIVRSLVQSFQ
jgi:flagellar biosynthesis protein FliP